MVYVGIGVFVVLIGMLLYVIFRPTHDYVAEMKKNSAKLEAQIKSYYEFEETMAKLKKEYKEEGIDV